MKNKSLVWNRAFDLKTVYKNCSRKLTGREVLVEIKATGICGTDLAIIAGRYPAAKTGVTIGHESAGVVVAIGPEVNTTRVGARVFINPTYYCTDCLYCRTNRSNHCSEKIYTESGVSKDGTFAKYYVTDQRFLYEMNDGISFAEASLAEPLSCVLTAFNQLNNIWNDARIILFGGGPIGLLFAHVLALKGLRGSIIEVSKARVELIEQVKPGHWQVFSSLIHMLDQSHDSEFDLIIDTSSRMLETGLQKLARGGEVLLIGLGDEVAKVNQMQLVDKSQRIIGSIDSIGTFNSACDMINKKRIPAAKLITHQFNIQDFVKAFAKVGLDLINKEMTSHLSAIKVILTQ